MSGMSAENHDNTMYTDPKEGDFLFQRDQNTPYCYTVPNLDNVEDLSGLCRLCATTSQYVVSIFGEEGTQNNVLEKIHKYLPIQISADDSLPKVLCYECMNTVIAWDELVECCQLTDTALQARLSSLSAAAGAQTPLKANISVQLPPSLDVSSQTSKENTCESIEVDHGPVAGTVADHRDQTLITNVFMANERLQHEHNEQTNGSVVKSNYTTNITNENQVTCCHSQSPTYAVPIQTTNANLKLSSPKINNELKTYRVNKIPVDQTLESENKLLIDNNFGQSDKQKPTENNIGNVREVITSDVKDNSENNANILDSSKMVAIIAESQIISIAALADADLGVNVSENPDIDITDLESTCDDEINVIANQDINDVHEGNYAEAINDAQGIVDLSLENAYNVAERSNKCSNNYESINDDENLDIVSCRTKVNSEPIHLASTQISCNRTEPGFKLNEMLSTSVSKEQDSIVYPSENSVSTKPVNENNISKAAILSSALDPKWVCEYCEEKQISEERHNEHLAERHSNKVFYCKRCKQFFDRQKLIRHMSRHLQELAPKPKEDPKSLKNNINTSTDLASTNSHLDSDKPSQHRASDNGSKKLSDTNKVSVDIPMNMTANLELNNQHILKSKLGEKSAICSLQRINSSVSDVAVPPFDPTISLPTHSEPRLSTASPHATHTQSVGQRMQTPNKARKQITQEPSLHKNEIQRIGNKLYLNLTSKVAIDTSCTSAFSDEDPAGISISSRFVSTSKPEINNSNSSQDQSVAKQNSTICHDTADKSKIVPKTERKIRTCPTCHKQYTASSSYFYHLKHAHTENKSYVCDECRQGFRTKANLIQHMPLHTGERNHRCQHCAKSFRTQAARYIHVKEVHSEGRAYTCDECNKSFKWAQKLFRHKQRHNSKRSYVCNQCKKSFNVKYDLSRHAKTHSAHKLFSCQYCCVTFSQSRYLKGHVDRVHLKRH